LWKEDYKNSLYTSQIALPFDKAIWGSFAKETCNCTVYVGVGYVGFGRRIATKLVYRVGFWKEDCNIVGYYV